MKYRIVYNPNSGEYYIQCRFLFIFWYYLKHPRRETPYRFLSEKEAKKHMEETYNPVPNRIVYTSE